MDIHRERLLGRTLGARCGRTVRVKKLEPDAFRIVLEPTGDRGRVELVAVGSAQRWTVSDRGAVGALYGIDLDLVIEKLTGFGTLLTRRGDELVAETYDRSLAESVAEFVDSIEFVPVLAGLYSFDAA